MRGNRRRPAVEALEGRALLSVAGSPDFSYAVPTISGVPSTGVASISFGPVLGYTQSVATAEALQSNGDDVVAGYYYTEPSVSGAPATRTIEATRLTPTGAVDTTFGTNGLVGLPAPSASGDKAEAVAIQSNGDILVAADVATIANGPQQAISVYRLTPTGALDTTFGTGGVATFSFVQGTTYYSSSAATLAIQSNGDIVVGGSASGQIGIARLTSSGSLDTTFGTGGEVVTNITSGGSPLANIEQGVAGLALDSSGNIDYDTTSVPTSGTGTEIAVGRLTSTGAADSTFGTAGQVIFSNSTSDTAGAIAIQSNGQIVVGGDYQTFNTTTAVETYHYDVYRLNTDGTLDTTFGTNGEATPGLESVTYPVGTTSAGFQSQVGSLLVESSGEIVVGAGGYAGSTDSNGGAMIAFLNPDGTSDEAGGGTGLVSVPGVSSILFTSLASTPIAIDGLQLQSDGKILALTDGGVARLLPSGSDNDFDNDGISDPAVLLPNLPPFPIFAYRPSGGGADVLTYFGTPGAGNTLPAPGAYDRMGVDELAVYLPTLGAYGIRPYGTTGGRDQIVYIGTPGAGNSIPAPADYTGAGFTQVGVFEPATATFVYSTDNSSSPSSDVSIPFGTPGAGNSIPVPADYTGSGQDELGVYLTQIGAFAYRPAGTTGGDDQIVYFGTPGAGNTIPVPGDYDGSGHTELGVYLPAIGAFVYRPYGTTGAQDTTIPFGIPGIGNSIPMLGDYDGSGHTELAVYMPSLDALAYRPYGTTGSDDKFIYFGEQGVGNTVPFNAQGAEYIESEGGGGGSGGGNGVSPGWVDFVPELAGQQKKANDGGTTSNDTTSQS